MWSIMFIYLNISVKRGREAAASFNAGVADIVCISEGEGYVGPCVTAAGSYPLPGRYTSTEGVSSYLRA